MILDIVIAGLILFGLFVLANAAPKTAIIITMLLVAFFLAKCVGLA